MSGDIIDQIIGRHEDFISYARSRTRNLQDAEDAVQSAYLKILRKNDLRDINPSGLMMTIIHNEAVSMYRKRKPDSLEEKKIDATGIAMSEDCPLPIELSETVKRAVDALPDAYKDVLSDVSEGLHYKEIVEKRGIPMGTVMSRLYRARVELQKAVSQCGYLVKKSA